MVKKLTILSLALLIALPLFARRSDTLVKGGKWQIKPSMNDKAMMAKTPYSGQVSAYFDKSANGYGWYQGYNRKISWNADPMTTSMVGSIYRRNNPATGSGTIGGTIGEWSGADLNFSAQVIYDVSDNFAGSPQDPGGRYPYSCGFINGYFFGVFNDYNTTTGVAGDAYPMFGVADATWGYSFSTWDVGVVAATDGGATVPGAWTGSGDTVYDAATG
ncbi:MAG: hypothetical protein GQ534_06745, partial [Candidatus Delongbacteria bacterium]|nr:hypothetical protein [Candidatus Delongbacteria bacterium]